MFDDSTPIQLHPCGDSPGEASTRTLPMYGVVLDLPEEFSEEIAAQRQEHCPEEARRIFPHITLKAPFTVADPRTLVPALEDVALRYLPVSLHAGGLGAFTGAGNNVLYVRVERSDRLLRLHEGVVRSLPNAQDVFPHTASHELDGWAPHITIAAGMTEERLEELRAKLEAHNLTCDWEARALLLVRSESTERGSVLWTTTRSFRMPS